jgi:transcriptional regulator with XRE-family HTH domain
MPKNVAKARPSVAINGEALKTFRILRGMSRQDLAERAKPASYSHIANLETEEKDPSPELVHRLALALDVPVSALLRERNVMAVAS